MAEFQIQGANVTFWLRVKAGSRREGLEPGPSGELCLKVSAPPTEGRANEACVRFLARTLRLPEACIVILTGRKSRRKMVRITGRSAEETIEMLSNLATKRREGKGKDRKAKIKISKPNIMPPHSQ